MSKAVRQDRLFDDLADDGVGRRLVDSRAGAGVLLTERDVAALRWIGEQYAVEADVLAWLLGGRRPLSDGRVRQLVDRWRRAGLVEARRFFAGGRSVVWPTREGLRLVLPGHRARAPKVSMLAHLHAVSLVRLGVERSGLGSAWVSERLLYRERTSPRSHVPDGAYTAADGSPVVVEVELSVKGADRLARIVGGLTLDHDRVLYVVADAVVERAVRRAVASVNEESRVEVVPLDQFASQFEQRRER